MRRNIAFYLKQKAVPFILYVIIVFIFWSVLYLHNLDAEGLDYAVLLSISLLSAFALVDFIRYQKHIKKIEYTLASLPYELREFPEARTKMEALYEDSLRDLFAYKEKLENDTRLSRQEMMDYYSLWAHQIKTPISAMNLLLQSVDEEEQEARFLQPMKMELFKTEQYVEMVLSYLRIGELSSDLKLQWYDVDEIVRQAVRKYSQLFILKKIRLDYQTCGGKVLTDEKWLLFVLEQLLSNALKYTSRGQISIYMEGGEKTALVIEDTGIGIQQEDLPRIFEKGFTGYNGRQDKKATGIGLYLCKSVCNKLNHGIIIDSEVGVGTKVRLDMYRDTLISE